MQCSVMYIAVRCGWYSQNASFFSLSPCVRVAVWGRWAVVLNDVAAAVADDLHVYMYSSCSRTVAMWPACS
jgi:hypothetical protein